MRRFSQHLAAALGPLCLALVLFGGVHGQVPAQSRNAELGAASPEAVLDRIRRAAERRDMFELAASIEPAGVREMAEGLAMITALTVAFSAMSDGEDVAERRISALDAIVSRYGLPGMDAGGPAERASVLDALGGLEHLELVNLVTDLAGFIESMAEEEEGLNSEFLPPIEGELNNLVMDGDAASARIGEDDIDFVRVNGRWFARLPEPPASSDSAGFDESWGDWESRDRAGSDAAEVLALPLMHTDALDQNGRRWYRYSAPESGAFSLSTRSTGQDDGDLVIEAYVDEDFSQSVARSDSDHDGDRAAESIAVGLQAGQVVHVRVSQWGFDRDPLSFELEAAFAAGEVVASASSDWGYAASNEVLDLSEAAQGQVLVIGQAQETSLGGSEVAWFIISAPAAGTLSVTTRGTGEDDGDLRLEAFVAQPVAQSVDYSDTDLLGELSYEIVRAQVDAGQLVYVRVAQGGSDNVSYRVMAEFAPR